jgi:hypothetical protein
MVREGFGEVTKERVRVYDRAPIAITNELGVEEKRYAAP